MIFIDTNIFVDYLRNFEPAISYLKKIKNEEILFSAITETELVVGKENNNPEKREILLQFLHQWKKIEVTNPIAQLAGDFARKYELDVPDAIIASSVMLSNAELITRNVKDFKKIPGLTVTSPY